MTPRSDRLPFARNEPFATRTAVVRDVTRSAICTMIGALEGRTPAEAARYYYERGSFELIEKASTSPATTTTAGWAANVVATGQAALAALSPQAASTKLLARCPLAFQFDRNQRKIMVPSLLANKTDIGFLTEGGVIPVIGGSVAAATLEPRTLPVIAVFSREALTRSLPNAEVALTNKLARGLALTTDKIMFDATAGDTTRPAGILVSVSPITASTATPADQAMRADVGALVAAVSAVAEESEIVLIGNPRQAAAYRLQYGVADAPFAMFPSSALAAGTCIAVATNCLAHASGGPSTSRLPIRAWCTWTPRRQHRSALARPTAYFSLTWSASALFLM